MKPYKTPLTFLLLLVCSICVAQDPFMKLARQVVVLEHQARYREAIDVTNRLIDTLKTRETSRGRGSYLPFELAVGEFYANIGDYTQAERHLRQTQAKIVSMGGKSGPVYRMSLEKLANLYVKMGNDRQAELYLEELVVAMYGNQDVRAANAAVKSQMQQIKNIGRGFHSKEDLINLYKASYGASFNYESMKKEIDEKWKTDSIQNAKVDSVYAAMHVDQLIRNDVIQKQASGLVSSDKMELLRKGQLSFTGQRNALDGNWRQVQKLFLIYERQHNYTAAEHLIKEAIGLDDHFSGTDPNEGIKKLMTPEMIDQLKKSGYNTEAGMLTKSMETLQKKGGADIYYLQNKVLLAGLYQRMGRKDKFKLLFDTIYSICKRFDTLRNAMTLNIVADSYTQIGRYRDAEGIYKRLIVYPPNQWGQIDLSSGNYLGSLENLSKLYMLTADNNAAESALQQSLTYDKNTNREDYPDHLNRVIELAQLFEVEGRLKEAELKSHVGVDPVLNAVKKNFGLLSEQEKIDWINAQISAFDFSASLLLTDKTPSEEFIKNTCNQQLQLKGMALADQEKVLQRIRNNNAPKARALLNRWHDNKSAIAMYYNQQMTAADSRLIDSLKVVVNQEEKQINELSSANDDPSQVIDVNKISSKLKQGEAAIEFIRFAYFHKRWTDTVKYAAFVILPNSTKPQFVPLVDEAVLAKLLNDDHGITLKNVADLYGTTSAGGNKLYDLIWKPLMPYLTNVQKIMLAPAGLLNRIAFNAIPTGKSACLIDQYDIREYGSVRQVAIPNSGKQTNGSITAVLYGGINYDHASDNINVHGGTFSMAGDSSGIEKYPPLPGSLSEVQSLKKILEAKKVAITLITDSLATEENLKQLSGNSPGILHVATHGFVKPDQDPALAGNLGYGNPEPIADPLLRTGIVMAGVNAPGGRDDGILTAYEIADLDLSNTDLVVLSACQTARGDIRGTEGVFGLQRAFKHAGVKKMMLSLWNLSEEDQSPELLHLFYQNKLSGIDDSEALRSAELALKSKGAKPRVWAPFVLIE